MGPDREQGTGKQAGRQGDESDESEKLDELDELGELGELDESDELDELDESEMIQCWCYKVTRLKERSGNVELCLKRYSR